MGNNVLLHPREIELEAGIKRFYGEGYTKWSEDNLRKLFNGEISQEDLKLLQTWESKGIIRLPMTTDCFMEVLDGFPGIKGGRA